MAIGVGTLIELRLKPEGLSGQIACPPGLRPRPGQYLVAASPDPGEPLPVVLFPSRISPLAEQAILEIAPPLPPAWTAGMQLALRGPLGSGFHMPPTVRRVALACPGGAPYRLLPLAEQALNQRAAVAIYAQSAPSGLPEEVEVLPLDLLPEAPAWADFLALEASLPELLRNGVPSLRSALGLNAYQRPGCQAEVLVVAAMPCSGLAECGICAIATRGGAGTRGGNAAGSGWALVCSDGPVFDLNLLEGF
jgi:hypothetical protein